MLSRVLFLVLVLAGGAVVTAQGPNETPLPSVGGTRTLFEQFADRLDLDHKTQFPEAEKLFTDASRQAPPIAQQMQQLRIRLVNAEIEKNEADIKAVLPEYRAAATKMAELEAQTFAKVYALLKPNQTSHAAEAFAIMAGVFLPPPPAATWVPRR